MQFLLMAVSIYTHRADNGLKRFGGKCDGQFLLNFYIYDISFIKQDIKVSQKLNDREILAYLLCTIVLIPVFRL